MRTVLLVALALVLSMMVNAQPTLDSHESHPSSRASQSNAPETRLDSHEIHADHTVTFRYRDPAATRVRLLLEGTPGGLLMVRGAGGIWSVTTPVLPPEIYRYNFEVDGRRHSDPENPGSTSSLTAISSLLHVPGPTPEPWDETAVPHGVVHRHVYTSRIVLGLPGGQSEYFVYTPPGYDARQRHHRYPVLYLLHGWSDKADGWTTIGQANVILDNLIAQRKVKPMVVVMPLGYGDMAFVHNGHQVWEDPAKVEHNLSLFTQALLGEILPQVAADYNVSNKREDRAIAGLSMGGLEALTVGLEHPELFAWVGGMSSAFHSTFYTRDLGNLDPKHEDLRLLWVACGTEDRLLAPNRAFAAFLRSRQMPVTTVETLGTHSWLTWRADLIQFSPLLFRKK